MGTKIFIGIIVLSVVLIGWTRFNEQRLVETDDSVISTDGIHWHPNIAISIKGENVEIPANIGLIGGHNPMHTHETDGTIHLEFDSVVREENLRLGQFFELWGKEFSSNQIFENVNSDTERVSMLVDGEENTEFENYIIKGEERIEVRFE